MTNTSRPRSWKYRRRCVLGALGVSGFVAIYVVVWGEDNLLHREAMSAAFGTIVACLAIYVGGAAGDDWLRDRESPKDS